MFLIFVYDGGDVPFPYRIANYDPFEDRYVCAPVGFHWLVRAWNRPYYRTALEQRIREQIDLEVAEVTKGLVHMMERKQRDGTFRMGHDGIVHDN